MAIGIIFIKASNIRIPLLNCSFNLLSFSLNLYSVAFIMSLPIHSSTVLSLCLPSLQQWSVNFASLFCGLKFPFNNSNSLVIVCVFCSICPHICTKWSLSPPSQLCMIGNFLFITNFIMFSEENIPNLHFKMLLFNIAAFGSWILFVAGRILLLLLLCFLTSWSVQHLWQILYFLHWFLSWPPLWTLLIWLLLACVI